MAFFFFTECMVRNVVMKRVTHQTLVLFLKSDCHQDPHDRRDLQRGSWELSTLLRSLTSKISDFQLLLLLCMHVVCVCVCVNMGLHMPQHM